MWVHLDYELPFVLFFFLNPKRVTHGLLVKTIDQPRFHNAVMNAQLSAGLDGVPEAVVVLSSHLSTIFRYLRVLICLIPQHL